MVLWVTCILYFSLILAGGFFARIYTNEKLASTYSEDLSSTSQFAASFETLLLKIRDMRANEVPKSKQIILMKENACSDGVATQVVSAATFTASDSFAKVIGESKFSIDRVLGGEELKDLCRKASVKEPGIYPLQLKAPQKFIVPYLFVLSANAGRADLFMISMDAGSNDGSELLELVTPEGVSVWKSLDDRDANAFFKSRGELQEQAKKTIASNLPGLSSSGSGLFASYAPVLGKWALFSYGLKSQVLSTVYRLEFQFLWLLLGSSLLIVICARRIVSRLAQPLTQLAKASEHLGRGDFSARLSIGGDPEFQLVQKTFNHMADELTRLVEVAKESSRMESELALAEKVQQVLLPPMSLKFEQHEIQGINKNAAECGGDWWGCIEVAAGTPKSRLLLMIGDVTGHGAQSALVTAAAQGCCSTISEWVQNDQSLVEDPRKLLSLFNKSVFRSSAGSLTMSFLAVVLDPLTETLTLANAGHCWPYLISGDGAAAPSLKPIGAASPVLGATLDQSFEHIETHPWKRGSKLFLYTDGLIDCYRGDQNLFDKRAMLRVLRANMGKPARPLMDTLMRERDSKTIGLPRADDVTVVICANNGGAS